MSTEPTRHRECQEGNPESTPLDPRHTRLNRLDWRVPLQMACPSPATGASETGSRRNPSARKGHPRARVTSCCDGHRHAGGWHHPVLYHISSPSSTRSTPPFLTGVPSLCGERAVHTTVLRAEAATSHLARATCPSLVTHPACVLLRGAVCHCAPHSRAGAPPQAPTAHADGHTRLPGRSTPARGCAPRGLSLSTEQPHLSRSERAPRFGRWTESTAQRLPASLPPSRPHPPLAPRAGLPPPRPAPWTPHTSEQMPTHSRERGALLCRVRERLRKGERMRPASPGGDDLDAVPPT